MRTLLVIVGIATVLILAGCGQHHHGHTINLPNGILYNIDHGFTCYLERNTTQPDNVEWLCERV